MKNFHIESLHEVLQPVIISLGRNDPFRFFSIRITEENVAETLNDLRQKWVGIFPGVPFKYSFFDEDFDSLYKEEERLGKIFVYFTALALVIACLGLLALILAVLTVGFQSLKSAATDPVKSIRYE